MAALNAISENLEKEALIKQKTLEMLPLAAENISKISKYDFRLQVYFIWLFFPDKLQVICGNGATRLMQLALEWETHRRPLVDKIRMIKSGRAKVWIVDLMMVTTMMLKDDVNLTPASYCLMMVIMLDLAPGEMQANGWRNEESSGRDDEHGARLER